MATYSIPRKRDNQTRLLSHLSSATITVIRLRVGRVVHYEIISLLLATILPVLRLLDPIVLVKDPNVNQRNRVEGLV